MRSLNVHNKDMDNRCLTIVGHKHFSEYLHFLVNFVRGGGSDKSCFNENKMLYIWVMIQLFLCPREGAFKKKLQGFVKMLV
jgi:hypothetical protein